MKTKAFCGILLSMLLGATLAQAAGPFALSYGGRLSNAADEAEKGPVDLEVKFFNAVTSGTQVGSTISKPSVPLSDGIFQIDLDVSPADLADSATFVEIVDKTHGKTYPRQQLTAVPYALRVPIDNATIKYNSAGQLFATTAGGGGGDLADADFPANGVMKRTGNGAYTSSPIVNADIDAAAGIVDSKLAQITTANKVADSALTSNVSLLGSTIDLNSVEVSNTLQPGKGGTGVATANQYTVFAGPTLASPAAPSFRLLTVDDIPVLGAGKITSGTFASALLPAMVGDSGAGGTKGAVPAPAANDASLGRFLKADGNWVVPPGTLPSQAADGTIGAPGIAFANDSDNGFYTPALNTIAYVTASNERFRIDSAGDVGIGTTNPTSLLHLFLADFPMINFQNSVSTGYIKKSGEDMLIASPGTGSVRLKVGAADRLFVSGGTVGIGTSAPGPAALEVKSNPLTQLTGTVDLTNGTAAIAGTSTLFTSELKPGMAISIGGTVYEVLTIGSNSAMTVSPTPGTTVSAQPVYADQDLLAIKSGNNIMKFKVDATGQTNILGGLALKTRSITTSTVLPDDVILFVTGNGTLTLPLCNPGRILRFILTASASLTFSNDSGVTNTGLSSPLSGSAGQTKGAICGPSNMWYSVP